MASDTCDSKYSFSHEFTKFNLVCKLKPEHTGGHRQPITFGSDTQTVIISWFNTEDSKVEK